MTHLFEYTIHEKIISSDDIFKSLRRCGVVINGVIHWGVYKEKSGLFSIRSDYTKEHFKGAQQVITKREIEIDNMELDSMYEPILTFKYLTSQ